MKWFEFDEKSKYLFPFWKELKRKNMWFFCFGYFFGNYFYSWRICIYKANSCLKSLHVLNIYLIWWLNMKFKIVHNKKKCFCSLSRHRFECYSIFFVDRCWFTYFITSTRFVYEQPLLMGCIVKLYYIV